MPIFLDRHLLFYYICEKLHQYNFITLKEFNMKVSKSTLSIDGVFYLDKLKLHQYNN